MTWICMLYMMYHTILPKLRNILLMESRRHSWSTERWVGIMARILSSITLLQISMVHLQYFFRFVPERSLNWSIYGTGWNPVYSIWERLKVYCHVFQLCTVHYSQSGWLFWNRMIVTGFYSCFPTSSSFDTCGLPANRTTCVDWWNHGHLQLCSYRHRTRNAGNLRFNLPWRCKCNHIIC